MPACLQKRLYDELRMALAATQPEDLKEWGKASAKRLPVIAARRVKNLGRLAAHVSKATTRQLSDAFSAWRKDRLGKHLEDRIAAGIDGSIEVAKQTAAAIGTVGDGLISDPRKNAPDIFALALGFYAGSGGQMAMEGTRYGLGARHWVASLGFYALNYCWYGCRKRNSCGG